MSVLFCKCVKSCIAVGITLYKLCFSSLCLNFPSVWRVHLMCTAVKAKLPVKPNTIEENDANGALQPKKSITRNKCHRVEAIQENTDDRKLNFDCICEKKEGGGFAVMIQMSVSHTWSLTCCSLGPLTPNVSLLLCKTLFDMLCRITDIDDNLLKNTHLINKTTLTWSNTVCSAVTRDWIHTNMLMHVALAGRAITQKLFFLRLARSPGQAKRVHRTVGHPQAGGCASCMRLQTPHAACVLRSGAAARRFAADASYPKHAAGVSVSTVSPT